MHCNKGHLISKYPLFFIARNFSGSIEYETWGGFVELKNLLEFAWFQYFLLGINNFDEIDIKIDPDNLIQIIWSR